MAEPSLALQKVIAGRLLDNAEIMDTIGPDGILDTIGRPERERCILIGQSQAVYRGEIATVYSTLHVWIKEPGLRLAKEVVGAVVDAVSFDAQIARQYIRKRGDHDGVDYARWSKEGFLTATPGSVIDNKAVANYIRDLCERFDVREVAFDIAYAQAVMSPLMDEGYPEHSRDRAGFARHVAGGPPEDGREHRQSGDGPRSGNDGEGALQPAPARRPVAGGEAINRKGQRAVAQVVTLV